MPTLPEIGSKENAAPVTRPKRAGLLAGAVLLALLCCLLAFLYFVARDRTHRRLMVHDQTAPPAAIAKPPAQSSPASVPAPESPARNAFRIEKGDAATIGPLRVKLSKVDLKRNRFDLHVLSGRRSYAHRHLRTGQTLAINLRGGGRLEMTVQSIEKDSVEGFWIEKQGTLHSRPNH